MAEGTQFIGDKLPMFDGINGYGWSMLAQQFWDARGIPEEQRLLEVQKFLTGRSSTWYQLWCHRNSDTNWETFDMAFLHQFQPDMHPILPEICCKEVEDWEIEWEEFKARLNLSQQQQQSQIVEICKSEQSTKQETATSSPELQESIEKVQKEENRDMQEIFDPKLQPQQQQKKKDQSTVVLDEEETKEEEYDLIAEPFEAKGCGDLGEGAAVTATPGGMTQRKEEIESEPPPSPIFSDDVDGDARSNAEFGASAKEEGKAVAMTHMPHLNHNGNGDGDAMNGGGGSNRRHRFLPLVARPAALMAVTFPWNRGSEIQAGKNRCEAANGGMMQAEKMAELEPPLLIQNRDLSDSTSMGFLNFCYCVGMQMDARGRW